MCGQFGGGFTIGGDCSDYRIYANRCAFGDFNFLENS